MNIFERVYNQTLEIELEEDSTLEEILSAKAIRCYHGCSYKGNFLNRLKLQPDKNIHVGSLFQAIWRSDFKVNDNESYPITHIYQIDIEPLVIYPKLVKDDGYNVEQSFEDSFKFKYDLLIYHNVGEGFAKKNNLSLIILNKDIIKKVKLHSSWDSERLIKYFTKGINIEEALDSIYIDIGHQKGIKNKLWMWQNGIFVVKDSIDNEGRVRHHAQNTFPEINFIKPYYQGRYDVGKNIVSLYNSMPFITIPPNVYRSLYSAFGSNIKIMEF